MLRIIARSSVSVELRGMPRSCHVNARRSPAFLAAVGSAVTLGQSGVELLSRRTVVAVEDQA
jgi:hypothetical protein